jgi:predicted dehydrogenase
MNKKILVVGCGSIGERHLRCFLKTARADVFACDTHPGLREKMSSEYGVTTFAQLNDALANSFDGMVICTPAQLHIGMALTGVRHGAALLIEKPLSTGFDGLDELKKEVERTKKFVGIAYVYHMMPAIRAAREFLQAGSLGKSLQISVVAGQHFPTFRPAYREIYYNNHKTGGGAIQDALTHLVNAIEWMVGPTREVYCAAAHQALDGVTVEDTVGVTAKNGSVLVSYSMNQFQAPNETTIQFHGEHGSLRVDVHEQRWGVFRRGTDKWEYHAAPVSHRDDLFIAQANAFLDGVEGKPNALCSLDEAIQTLKFNLAALESVRSGQSVPIS